jgi:hypothetical protein
MKTERTNNVNNGTISNTYDLRTKIKLMINFKSNNLRIIEMQNE